MKIGIKRLFITTISLFTVLTFLVSGCGQPLPVPVPEPSPAQPAQSAAEVPPSESQVYIATSAPSHIMKAQLSLAGSPVLGKPVPVTFTFALKEIYPWDAPRTTAQIKLPEGFELVSGDLEWRGDVSRGTTYEVQATIKAVKIGDWKIEAMAGFSVGASYLGGSANLYISVFEGGATVSERVPVPKPPTIPGKPPIPPIEPWMVPKVQSFLPPSAPLSGLTIRGYAECPISENRLPHLTPNRQLHPTRLLQCLTNTISLTR